MDDPLVAPLQADLTGLPPLLIQAGSGDTVVEEARARAEHTRAHGVHGCGSAPPTPTSSTSSGPAYPRRAMGWARRASSCVRSRVHVGQAAETLPKRDTRWSRIADGDQDRAASHPFTAAATRLERTHAVLRQCLGPAAYTAAVRSTTHSTRPPNRTIARFLSVCGHTCAARGMAVRRIPLPGMTGNGSSQSCARWRHQRASRGRLDRALARRDRIFASTEASCVRAHSYV